ncbi:hypothetical protein CDEST_15223 [Colletotrichum destructivum]|uniref:Uncharacterized protein n=1 Tax=Colletotrichum destructivum TaxID=34406 RepID=A0AAX4J3Q1_9PEZI|nr:hypothetical protein CDEST_15223 [Colletotrichum destructivum]
MDFFEIGDGSTTQNFLDKVGQLYDGKQLAAPPQYSNFDARQRSDVQSGQMDADPNRASIQDVSTMGFFAILLPVRLAPFEPAQTLADELEAVKERLRQAMQHARVPYAVEQGRLGLVSSSADLSHASLFQVVFDYRQKLLRILDGWVLFQHTELPFTICTPQPEYALRVRVAIVPRAGNVVAPLDLRFARATRRRLE